MKPRPIACTLLFFSLAALSPASAKDHFLTIGGGFSPAGNQISLERNVIFFRKLLADKLPAGAPHDLYFADGSSPHPDLNYQLENSDVPRANELMADLFGTTEDIDLHYRNNELKDVRGVSSPGEVEKWFKETGSKLESGDRLVLYVTAHGGRSGQKDNRHNTKIYMWNRQSMEASKLASLINGLPKDVSVMTVMVQCFSGGFSHLIFNDNNAKKGDSERNVCGFFATVHDREAAGCTPDILEENYDEFSSHFWAAIRGRDRMDKTIADCDYDGSGAISFEEAHAYVLLTSKNVDVPVKTSDAFLRVHSKLEKKEGLLSLDTPYDDLLELARPAERAVLEGLSNRLKLDGPKRGIKMRELAEKEDGILKKIAGEKKEQKKAWDGVRREIARDMRNRLPSLSNTHSPGAQRLLSDERAREEFVKAVENHPKFPRFKELSEEREEFEERKLKHEKLYAQPRRFVRALENVALAANLEKVAKKDIQERYANLLAAEGGTLGATTALE